VALIFVVLLFWSDQQYLVLCRYNSMFRVLLPTGYDMMAFSGSTAIFCFPQLLSVCLQPALQPLQQDLFSNQL